MSIEKIKPVYSDEMLTIFVCTNRGLKHDHSDVQSTPSKYLYSNGDFFNITSHSPVMCNKAQQNFLLDLMTQFGTF